MKKFVNFLKQDDGTTAIEYALIAALIAVVIFTSLTTLSNKVTGLYGLFTRLANAMR